MDGAFTSARIRACRSSSIRRSGTVRMRHRNAPLFRSGRLPLLFYNFRADQVPFIGRLHMRDPEQVPGFVQRFCGNSGDRMPLLPSGRCACAYRFVAIAAQRSSPVARSTGNFVRLFRVDDDLKEWYDNFFLRISCIISFL